jgi:uncharacterized protein (TIGR02996 family)
MSADGRNLIEAIRADPEDDFVRQVYADWLEEQGQPDRAELVRVQLALPSGRRSKVRQTPKQVRTLKAREQELLKLHEAEWLGPLAQAGVRFERGLGVAHWSSLPDLQKGGRLLEQHGADWVVECRLRLQSYAALDEQIQALLRMRRCGLLTRLEASSWDSLTSASARAIADSPRCGNLRGLRLGRADLGIKGAKALASSPHLQGLRELDLGLSRLGPKGIAALVSCKGLKHLTELRLYGAVDDDASIRELAQALGLPRLLRLDLTGNRIGDAQLKVLLRSPLLSRLEELVLAGNNIRDGGASAIADCEALVGLKVLNLNRNKLTDPGVLALLKSPHLVGLEQLHLTWMSKITEPVRRKVRRRFR